MFHDSISQSGSMQSRDDPQQDSPLKLAAGANLKFTTKDLVHDKLEVLSENLISLLHDCPQIKVNVEFGKMK